MIFKRLMALIGTAGLFVVLSFSGYGTEPVFAQGSMPFSENFTGFSGAGFDTAPSSGRLDSDTWRVTGLSDGSGTFGGTHTTGDFARGVSPGAASTGGIYAFNVGGGTTALGVQPAGSDFTPGTITLRIQNTTGSTITSLTIAYDIYVNNDQNRANSFNFAYSLDDITYTSIAALDYTSPATADSLGWTQIPRTTTINSLNISNGAFFYLQWQSDDVSGSGSRDELGITNISVTAGSAPSDTAPTVNTTTPTNGATGVANNTNIVIDFSESVTTSTGWFNVTCSTSGDVTTDYTNTPSTATTHTLTYSGSGLSAGETCTVTINATNVTDADTDDPPDNMAADYVFNFTVATPVVFDLIHDIQGNGAAVTGSGPFTVEAVVIADYQNSNQLRGFFIQEEDADADADPTTSEGIFVYCNSCPVDVNVGDLVRVTGNASDYFDMSQLSATGAGDITIVSNSNPLPSPATINIGTGLVSPVGDKNSFYEPFEGCALQSMIH
ncbi:MAG: hypothetical protein Kow00117_00140 [Phototrophicales bacterium]